MPLVSLSDRARNAIFFTTCLPVRIALAMLILFLLPISPDWLSFVAGAMLVLAAFSWLSFSLGCRTRETGAFGGPAYWAPARLIHAIFFLSSGVLCFLPGKETTTYAGLLLLGDVGVGASNVLVRYDLRPCRRSLDGLDA